MTESMLAISILLLLALVLFFEARRNREAADALGHITEWMKCQTRIELIRDRQIEILTGALKRADLNSVKQREETNG